MAGVAAAVVLAMGPQAGTRTAAHGSAARMAAARQNGQQARPRHLGPSALADGLERYLGQRVSLSGRVVEVFGDRMLGLGVTQGSRTVTVPVLAVRAPRPAAGRSARSPVRVGDLVAVVGQVSRFTVSAETTSPQAAVMASQAWRFTSRPAVVADTVAVLNVNSSQNAAVDPGGMLVAAQGKSLIGRWVSVLGVTVESVDSDRGFWVRAADSSRFWVMLSPALNRGRMERLVSVREGQELDIVGRLMKMPTAAQMRSAGWTVTAAEAARIQREPFYLRANSIKMHSGSP